MKAVRQVIFFLLCIFLPTDVLFAEYTIKDMCSVHALDAQQIMQGRQEGISRGAIIEDLFDEVKYAQETRPIIEFIFNSAFDVPVQKTYNSKRLYNLIFGLVHYQWCANAIKKD